MRHHRSDVVERAIDVLDMYGLPDMSMRRIASELGLQPSALYHHFANKQALLAAVAYELLVRGARVSVVGTPWDEAVVALGHELRDAMLAYRDGAELIATAHAFGLGVQSPLDRIATALVEEGFDPELARGASTTIVHFVFGHVYDEQTQLQAASAGAIDGAPLTSAGAQSFEHGLALIIDGSRLRRQVPESR
ncbi:TetR/AcrR family transcriptional regulator C-terminal domain-containing protein [Aeromicrobium sp.]|uniref:TetR/AcrR family transcriptional regulator C-terminal domain-containing protein n=1 Tax=Aeromicrobium sp. TaxID=1871063 RepID=UPI003C4AC7D5